MKVIFFKTNLGKIPVVVGVGAVVVVSVGTVRIKAKSILLKTPKYSSFRNRQPT